MIWRSILSVSVFLATTVTFANTPPGYIKAHGVRMKGLKVIFLGSAESQVHRYRIGRQCSVQFVHGEFALR